jgi:hypothetical protein
MFVNIANRNRKCFLPSTQDSVDRVEEWDHYATRSGYFMHQWESHMHIGLVY